MAFDKGQKKEGVAMQPANKPLGEKEREELRKIFENRLEAETQSRETSSGVLIDNKSKRHQVGGTLAHVKVDEVGTPEIFNEQNARVIDCGHSVTSVTQIGGQCSYGHIVCKEHELKVCSKCRKVICHLDLAWKNDQPICRQHRIRRNLAILITVITTIVVYVVMGYAGQ